MVTKYSRRRGSRAGFSLAELMAVVAVMGLIAGIVAFAILVIAVASQGRLKHVVLMLLGATERRPVIELIEEIPRAEHDWRIVGRLDPRAAPIKDDAASQ